MKLLTTGLVFFAIAVPWSLESSAQGATGATGMLQERTSKPALTTMFPKYGFDCTGCPSADDRVFKIIFDQPIGFNPSGGYYPQTHVACVRNPVMVGDDRFEADFISADMTTTCDFHSFEDSNGGRLAKHGFLRIHDVIEVFFRPAK